MSNSYKAVAIRDQLASDLKLRLPALAETKGFDGSGNPTLLLGAGTAGSQSAFIRVKQFDSIGFDVLGLTQNVFTPHQIQLVVEMSTITDVQLLVMQTWIPLLGELFKEGCRLEVYMSPNGNAPDVADITAANLRAAFETHIQYPTMATI